MKNEELKSMTWMQKSGCIKKFASRNNLKIIQLNNIQYHIKQFRLAITQRQHNEQ